MSCPGLHCPGCSEGQSIVVLGAVAAGMFVAYEAVGWVAKHIWEIGGTLVVCFALSIAISMWMERWAVVRGTRFAVARGIASQADIDALNPVGVAWLERERVRELERERVRGMEQAQRDALRHQQALEIAAAILEAARMAGQQQPSWRAEPVRFLRGEVER